MIMKKMNKEHIKNTFKDYVEAYDATDSKIALKIAHTYRVAELSDQIAESINLNDKDRELAWTIGMLHDIARFEQVRIYGTFNDSMSVDHAEFGADLLFSEGLVDRFEIDKNWYPTIEVAIRNHNKYRLPAGLSERDLTFCKIIRDADKIDIIRVNYETPMEEIYNTSKEVLVNDRISDQVFNAFFEESAINHSLKQTTIDRLVGHVSLCFELEYDKSRELLLKQGYLEKLLSFKSNIEETNSRLKEIGDYIFKYLKP